MTLPPAPEARCHGEPPSEVDLSGVPGLSLPAIAQGVGLVIAQFAPSGRTRRRIIDTNVTMMEPSNASQTK